MLRSTIHLPPIEEGEFLLYFVKNAKLTDRLEKVLKQLSVTVEEMTVYDKED